MSRPLPARYRFNRDIVRIARAKSAMISLTKCLNQELNQYGIQSTAICPAYVDTPVWQRTGVDRSQFLQPEDVAATVAYLWQLPSRVRIDSIYWKALLCVLSIIGRSSKRFEMKPRNPTAECMKTCRLEATNRSVNTAPLACRHAATKTVSLRLCSATASRCNRMPWCTRAILSAMMSSLATERTYENAIALEIALKLAH